MIKLIEKYQFNLLNHLIVDEYELYDDFMIILDNIKHIEEINVITKTVVEMLEIILYTMDYMTK